LHPLTRVLKILVSEQLPHEEDPMNANAQGDGHVIHLNGETLSFEDVMLASLGYNGKFPLVALDPDAEARIIATREVLDARGEDSPPIYGYDTGCGSRRCLRIPHKDLVAYQASYIPVHAVGLGNPLPDHLVRAMILLRVNSFAKGNSAVTITLCRRLLELLNNNWLPVVPDSGSVGASGDLIPLAHLGTVLMGVPEAYVKLNGTIIRTDELQRLTEFTPYVLQAKEAMALTNGATMILARAIFAYLRSLRFFHTANLAAALHLEAIRGERAAFDARIHKARNDKSAMAVAHDVRKYLKGSLRTTRKGQCIPVCESDDPKLKTFAAERVQDDYSTRAVPQAHGAVLSALNELRRVLLLEMNASTDNPLIFEHGGRMVSRSGANFHGDPLAVPLEGVKIAMAKLARITNDRLYGLLDHDRSYGLPNDLVGSDKHGMTGFMIAQYGAASDAAFAASMCFPATLMSIPTSKGTEDYVSMASVTVEQLELLLRRVGFLMARCIHATAQAISLGEPKLRKHARLGTYTGRAYAMLRELFPMMEEDSFFQPELLQVLYLVENGDLDFSNK